MFVLSSYCHKNIASDCHVHTTGPSACYNQTDTNLLKAHHMTHRPTLRDLEKPTTTPKEPMGVARTLFAEVFLTVGALLLSFAFYQAFWTNIEAGNRQAAAGNILAQQWENPRKNLRPEVGDAFANIYIPAFGTDFVYAIVQGVEDKDLDIGPGHYEDTQMPGEPGNMGVAGHRVGTGAPFNDLGRLNTCDSLIIETQDTYHIYKVAPMEPGTGADCFTPEQNSGMTTGQYANVVGRHITTPLDVSVIEPVPGNGSGLEQGKQSMLTLTTCHPQFSDRERMIIHAFEVDQIDKATGQIPEEMKG